MESGELCYINFATREQQISFGLAIHELISAKPNFQATWIGGYQMSAIVNIHGILQIPISRISFHKHTELSNTSVIPWKARHVIQL